MNFIDTSFLRNADVALRCIKTEESCPKYDGAPVYYFEILNCDNDVVGMAELRIGHNDALYYYGNVYCKIQPRYEGFKYGLKASKLMMILAKQHNMGYVSITCDHHDVKCKATCELLGMKLLEEATLPADHPIRGIGIENADIYVLDVL